MTTRYSLREQLQQLATQKGATQRAIAEKLGVSERTIRRWKNEGVRPSAVNADAVSVLRSEAARVRKQIIRQSERYADVDPTLKQGIAKPIQQLRKAKPLPAARRRLRDEHIGYKTVRRKNKKTGKYEKVRRDVWTYRLSDYVMYDVRVLNQREQIEFIKAALEDGSSVQLVFTTRTYGDKSRYMTTSPTNPAILESRNGTSIDALNSYLKFSSADGLARSITGKAARIIVTPNANAGRHYK